MALLDRAAIFGTKDLRTRDVDIEDWGGTVRVRALTARQLDTHQQTSYAARGKDGKTVDPEFRARVVALGVIDEDGKRIFIDDDIPELSTKSGAALEVLFEAIMELTGTGAKAVERAEKNSGKMPGSASSSASPGISVAPSANSSTASAPTS